MSIYASTFLLIYCLVLAFVLGTVFGSFLNCVAGRIETHEKWWVGKSKCDSCGHELRILDLFPILSYIFLKGKCRYCGAKMSIQYLLTEVLLGCIFAGYVAVHGTLDLQLLCDLGLICVLFGLSICDFHTYEIPDGFIIFGIFWWLFFQLLMQASWKDIGMHVLVAVCVSGAVLVISITMDKILQKETMGGGDIKLLFLVGLRLGIMESLLNLMISCIIGLLFIGVMKKEKIPFGPAISIACVLVMMIGTPVVEWYMGLFL